MMPRYARGFSLVELSIVLVVIGIIAGSSIVPFTASLEQSQFRQTTKLLTHVRQVLHGYLITNGRLPCPVPIQRSSTNDASVQLKTQTCQIQHGGVPAVLLGTIGHSNSAGALLDVWGRPFHYVVSLSDNETAGLVGEPDWLTSGEASSITASKLKADLELCRRAANSACRQSDLVATDIVWVVFSLGSNLTDAGFQAENLDNDNVFAVSPFSSSEASPFDDQLVWASRSELVYWLLKANWLP